MAPAPDLCTRTLPPPYASSRHVCASSTSILRVCARVCLCLCVCAHARTAYLLKVIDLDVQFTHVGSRLTMRRHQLDRLVVCVCVCVCVSVCVCVCVCVYVKVVVVCVLSANLLTIISEYHNSIHCNNNLEIQVCRVLKHVVCATSAPYGSTTQRAGSQVLVSYGTQSRGASTRPPHIAVCASRDAGAEGWGGTEGGEGW